MNLQNKLSLSVLLLTMVDTAFAVCKDNISLSTPSSRFVINDDGTLIDKQTNLMWMRCSLGQTWGGNVCTDNIKPYTWASALSAAESMVFSDYSDWYLPNVKELSSIVELACYSPSVNSELFPNSSDDEYWTSSSYFGSEFYAWYVQFTFGFTHYRDKKEAKPIRLVRNAKQNENESPIVEPDRPVDPGETDDSDGTQNGSCCYDPEHSDILVGDYLVDGLYYCPSNTIYLGEADRFRCSYKPLYVKDSTGECFGYRRGSQSGFFYYDAGKSIWGVNSSDNNSITKIRTLFESPGIWNLQFNPKDDGNLTWYENGNCE